jgi:hypothetical protein
MARKVLSILSSCGIGLFVVTAMAADLPKEGTFSGTCTGLGTFKTTKIGDDRALVTFDETGAQLTNGFADHTTFHCWGTVEITKGERITEGYCVGTDPTGDLLEVKVSAKNALSNTVRKGSNTFIGGSGKYAGISGAIATTNHEREFRPLTDGTYVSYVTLEGNCKLP